MNVFLTGSTGFVGGEMLVQLSKKKEINKIYCFLRAFSEEDAMIKLENVFRVHHDAFDQKKINPIIGNLFDEHLTDELIANKAIEDTDVVIHSAANTSFSKIYDDMIERANMGGLEKILLWAKQLPHLQTFTYIGTATICGKDIKNRTVKEDESPNLQANHLVKYTYTKMQGELLIDKHLPQEKILIARPSIILGDSRNVVPRSPVILWAVATINHLRFVPVNEFSKLDMIPVDYTVDAIVRLLLKKRKHKVYHISSGEAAATSAHDLANTLNEYFEDLPPFHFADKGLLNQVKNWAKNRLKPESELYNYQEYLDYWKLTFEDPSAVRILLAGLDPYLGFMELGQVFDNSRLLEELPELKQSLPAHEYIRNSMAYIERIDLMEGAINP
jgi:thioester reductase-like protein